MVRLLAERPEWRSELRELLLSDDLPMLSKIIRELAEAQYQTGEHLKKLVEVQQQSHTELKDLKSTIYMLIEQTRYQVEGQKHNYNAIMGITNLVLDARYREKAYAYFAYVLRRIRVVDIGTLAEDLEARLPFEEFKDIFSLDLVIKGKLWNRLDISEVLMAIEISAVLEPKDITRVYKSAHILRKAGYLAIPAVAGEHITLEAEAEARLRKAVVVLGEKTFLREEALQAWVDQPERSR